MAKPTAVWRWVDNNLVEAFGSEASGKPEWRELMAETAARRQDMQALAAKLTNSALAHMALTAINFFVRDQARPFAPEHLNAALQHLKIPEPLWPRVRPTLAVPQGERGADA